MAADGKSKRWLKRILGIVLGLVAGLLCAYIAITLAVRNKMSPGRFVIEPRPVEIPEGEEALERGRHLVHNLLVCTECHGDDLGGDQFIDAPPMGRFGGVNLTRGQGGLPADYDHVDWVRAIRHGAGHDGRGLLFMPTLSYARLGDEDVGAIVAYLQQLPPIDRQVVAAEPGTIGRFLVAFGKLPIEAEDLDHATVGLSPGSPGEDARYGEYLVRSSGCVACHRENLEGGEVGPNDPPASNLTPAALAEWSYEDFVRAMREGRRPDGRELDPFMPWRAYQGLSDLELTAMWNYLQTVDPVEP